MCWSYTNDLHNAVRISVRDTDDHYAVWVHDSLEPDIEYLGKAVCLVDTYMKIGITVLERIIFEIKYFSETGNHLDIKKATLCSGSRNSKGNVIYTSCNGNGFNIDWCTLDYCDSHYSIREVAAL